MFCFLPKIEIHEESSSHFRPKKPKPTPSEDRRFNRSTPSPPPRPPTSTTTTGYIQGMSLIINNSSDSSQHDMSGRISTSGVTESREIPGAIAIPIQVCWYYINWGVFLLLSTELGLFSIKSQPFHVIKKKTVMFWY